MGSAYLPKTFPLKSIPIGWFRQLERFSLDKELNCCEHILAQVASIAPI